MYNNYTITSCVLQYNAATRDYGDPLPLVLIFEVGATVACTAISSVVDFIYEEDETFLVDISSTQDGVVIDVNSSIIIITDNDGE